MSRNPTGRPTVAVIGGGVAGLTAAWTLRATHDVTVFEADERLGGHAHTHDVPGPAGPIAIDSGFIVHNDRTYPVLTGLFRELGVATRATEMSMSISCAGCGLEYAGGRGATGILAQPQRLRDPRFVRMLTEVTRFHADARALLAGDGEDVTWGEFVRARGYSDYFVRHFATPLVGCVWSSGDADTARYPARHLFAFLAHHGMLSVSGSPTWRTVVGGSRSYVDALATQLPDVRLGTPVTAVRRHTDGVDVTAGGQTTRFDQVVAATHADITANLLVDADPEETTALSAIGYSTNRAVLHHDRRVLPRARNARASWNLALDDCTTPADRVRVSYWMNRLHGLTAAETGGMNYLVSLNPTGLAPESLIAEMTYQHPIFTQEAVRAAAVLREAGGPRLAFAGAHLGWGFHEDGARSGLAAALRLSRPDAATIAPSTLADQSPAQPGSMRSESAQSAPAHPTPAHPDPARPDDAERIDLPTLPALAVGRVRHTRSTPTPYAFEHPHTQWLVDVDALPRFRGPARLLARFRDADHLDGGRLGGGIRGDLTRLLAGRGVVIEPSDRIVMLAHARSLGHVFDPLTVYWCLTPERRLRALVLEVHNTYGERHAYVVPSQGAEVDKAFYVSPFNDLRGHYQVRTTLTPHRVSAAITLIRDGEPVLVADTVGTLQPVSGQSLRALARGALMPHRVSGLIRFHGIRLWAKRLPVRPRPDAGNEGVR